MKDNTLRGIKIASGVAIVTIAAVKIVKNKIDKTKEEPENEKATEQPFCFRNIYNAYYRNIKHINVKL